MDPYKPQYLGKVMPAEPPKLKTFLQDKFDQFGKAYDACKGESNKITDIKDVSSDDKTLTVKVTTDKDAIEAIAEKITKNGDPAVSIDGDAISVTPA